MAHEINVVVTAVVDGETRSWGANATTDLNPWELASTLSNGVREQAARDLRAAGFRYADAPSEDVK
jgi:hypothetical protein